MLEQFLLWLEKNWLFAVICLLWGALVSINIYAAWRRATKPPIGQSAELPGEIDEALRWLEELEERNKKMPDNRIYVDFNDERLLKAIKVEHYELDPDIKFQYVEAHNDPFDPEWYFCSICGRSGVKLWREAMGFGNEEDKAELLCAFCLGDVKGNNLRGKNVLGKKITNTSTLFDFFPAIPMMGTHLFQGFLTIRTASKDNILVNHWLKLGD